MARVYFFLALILQASFIYANIDEDEENENTLRNVLNDKPIDADDALDIKADDKEWIDIFSLPSHSLYPTSAAAKMNHALNSDKSAEEQLEDMKEMANQIFLAIQSEMANLLSYALKDAEKETIENGMRKKRSAESPMDSSKLVTRLLKYIKNNNEYQNIAIEKMMSAQEIADKFGIDFTPDADIFSDLAIASSKQTEELSLLLNDAYNTKNVTSEQIEFVPVVNETNVENCSENSTYFVYSVHVPEEEIVAHLNTPPHYEYLPERIDSQLPVTHMHYEPHTQYSFHYTIPVETPVAAPVHSHYTIPIEAQTLATPVHNHFTIPIETQIVSPPVYRPSPVSYMPKFYEPIVYVSELPQYHPMEPMTTTTTIVLPIEEIVEPEPELVGEEFEETVTSRVIVDRGEEPGSATVNHVMTYSISEKSHYKTPEIKNLPQQMQYYFFLM